MRSPLGTLASLLRNAAPVPFTPRASGGGQPILRTGGTETQMRAMGSVGTLFAIVDRLATSTAAADWYMCRTARPGERPEDREEVTRHAALDLWTRPNRHYTQQMFIETFSQHYELVGEGWWVVARSPLARSLPLELWPVMPHRIHPIPDPDEYLAGYMYLAPDGQQIPLALDEVIHIRRPNPIDPYRGIGPVQTILADLEGVRLSAEYNRNFFLNSAEPGGVIEIDRRLSDDEYDEMVKRWREQHQGTYNAHRVALIEGGARWVERAYTRRDMQFAEMRAVSSEVIREAFGIPKFALGLVDDVNRANAEASKALFAEQMTVPRLERIKQALNSQLLPLFGATGRGVEFDFVSPVPADRDADNAELTARAAAAKTLIEGGLPRTYALATAGLPELTPDLMDPEPADPAEPDEPAEPAEPEGPEEPEGVARARAVAELVPKVTPGVDKVLLWEEARAILAEAGADLDPAAEKPEPPAPPAAPAAPGGGPDEPDEPEDGPGEPGDDPDDPGEPEDDEPESEAGRSTAHATPRLTAQAEALDPGELPDVTPLGDQLEADLEDLLAQWGPITDAQKAALIEQIKAAVEAGDLDALTELEAPTGDAEDVLTDAMAAAAAAAAAITVQDAAAQGVDIDPAEPDRDTLNGFARVIVRGLAADLATSAGREALRVGAAGEKTGEQVADAVAEHLQGLSDAQPRQRLGQALHTAQHQARGATYERAENATGRRAIPSVAYYGSEKLDRNTCGPCREIDGRWLGNTWQDVLRDYPTGGYERCEGRDRCRGHVVAVYRPEQVGDDGED